MSEIEHVGFYHWKLDPQSNPLTLPCNREASTEAMLSRAQKLRLALAPEAAEGGLEEEEEGVGEEEEEEEVAEESAGWWNCFQLVLRNNARSLNKSLSFHTNATGTESTNAGAIPSALPHPKPAAHFLPNPGCQT